MDSYSTTQDLYLLTTSWPAVVAVESDDRVVVVVVDGVVTLVVS